MNRRFLSSLAVAAFMLAGATAALAHHGTNVSYDPTKEVTMTGTVTRFVWSNPHGQLHFQVTDSNGQTQVWGGELHSIGLMTRAGWNRNIVKVGDTVTVTGHPSRAGTPYMVVTEVKLNGKSYFRDLGEQGGPAQ